MFKKKSKSDDEFSFDTGDAMFDMDDPFDNKVKPPKGVKGYLKNVAKSVKNIGVKAFKTTLPEVDSLVESLKIESDDMGSDKIKSTLNLAKKKTKEYVGMGKDIAKETISSAKDRVKTGYFFKSEEDNMGNMDDMFGSDDDYLTSSDDNSYLNTIVSKPSRKHRSSHISNSIDKIGNATLGAAQASIEAENVLFSQQMVVSQEQHRQKMAVMKNIATNVGKLINQNNSSIKAQMEYSLKLLAFSQDTAAMIKEIRDANWKMITPKEKEKDEKSSYNSIYGSGGFDNKSFFKNFKNNIVQNAFGGALDSLGSAKDMIRSFSGMPGMDPKSMLLSMGKDMAFNAILNASTSKNFKNLANRANRQAEGLPGAFNRLLGGISDGNIKTPEFLKKRPEVMNKIREFAGYAHVEDTQGTNRNKYAIGNPNEVHPFDTKAHKALTEVIPKILGRIDAGVNNTEETYFDYKENSFKSVSSLKNKIQASRDSVLEYSEGYSDASDATTDFISSNVSKFKSSKMKDKNGKSNAQFIKKCNKILFKNLMSMNVRLGKDELEQLSTDGSFLNDKLKDGLPFGDSDEDKADAQEMVVQFVNGLRKLSSEDPETYEKLQISMTSYNSKYTAANYEIEDEMGEYGSSITFNQLTRDEQIDKNIKENSKRKENAKKRYDQLSNNAGKSDLSKASLNKQKFKEMENYRSIDKNLKDAKNGTVNDIIGSNNVSSISSEDEDKYSSLSDEETTNSQLRDYEIKSLSNNSTNGIVKNIYNLLLDGIVTYPNMKGMSDEVSKRYKTRNSVLNDSKQNYLNDLKENEFEKEDINKTAEEDAKERLSNKEAYRNMFEETDRADFLKKMPFIGKLLEKGGAITETAMNFVTSLTGQKFYGVQNEKNDETVKQGEEKIKKTYNNVKAKVLNKKDVIKQYSDNFIANVKADGLKTALVKASKDLSTYKVGGKISPKDIVDTFKKNGVLKTLDISARKAEELIKDNKFTAFAKAESAKIPDYFKEESGVVKNKVDSVLGEGTSDKIIKKTTDVKNGVVKLSKKAEDKLRKEYDKLNGEGSYDALKQSSKDKLNNAKDFLKNNSAVDVVEKTGTSILNKGKEVTKNIFTDKLTKKTTDVKNGVVKLSKKEQKQLRKEYDKAINDSNTVDNEYWNDLSRKERRQENKEYKADINTLKTKDKLTKKTTDVKNGVVKLSKKAEDKLRKEYDSKFGKGSYDSIINNPNTVDNSKVDNNNTVINNKVDNNSNTREEGTVLDQAMDKKEAEEKKENKERMSLLKKIAVSLGLIKKDGIDLGKNTKKDMEENNNELLRKLDDVKDASGEGWSSKVNSFIDKTGLGNTKVGSTLKSAASGLNKGTDFVKSTKLGGKIFNKVSGILGIGGGAAAKAAAGGAAKEAAGAAVKGAAGNAAGNGGLISKALEAIKKLIGGICKSPKIAATAGKEAGKGILKGLTEGIKKLGKSITSRLAGFLGSASTLVPLIATAVLGFTKGMLDAKKTFGVGVGMKITKGMRVACGFSGALDGVLLGIPGLIAKLFGFANPAQWIYSLIGNKVEKETIERYKKYNSLRATIFGIDDPEKLISYENHNVADKAGRAVLNVVTFGIAKSNDEKEAGMLGFKSVEIFKYWKEKKYTPLNDLRETVAQKYGGIDYIEKFMKYDDGKSGVSDDPTTDEDESENENANDAVKAEKQFEAIQKQQEYRKEYLEAARKYVLDNHLAWCTTHCTLEMFNKFTGKTATTIEGGKKRVLKGLKKAAIVAGGVALLGLNPVAGAVVIAGAMGVNKLSSKVDLKEFTKKVLNIKEDDKGKNTTTQKGFRDVDNNIDNTLSSGTKSNMSSILNIFKAVFADKKIRETNGISLSYPAVVQIMNIVGKYADADKIFGEKLANYSYTYSDGKIQKKLVKQGIKSFNEGLKNPMDKLGVNLPKETISNSVRITAALVSMFEDMLPEADEACKSIKHHELKYLIYNFYTSGTVKANSYDDFNSRKGKILGISTDNMKAYEEKLYGKSWGILHGLKSWLSNMWNGAGSANIADAALCGFVDVDVFKYWKDHKYQPIRKIEVGLASTYSSTSEELLSDSCENVTEQKAFRKKFLKEAEKYVKTKGLEWLTSKTTYAEFAKRKKDKTLENADAYIDPTTNKEINGNKSGLQKFGDGVKSFFGISDKGAVDEKISTTSKGSITKQNPEDLTSKDTAEIAKKIQSEYKFSKENATVIAGASTSIKNYYKTINPNFYGDMAPDVNASKLDGVKNGENVYGQNGGSKISPSSTSEGFRITEKKHNKSNEISATKDNSSKTIKPSSTKLSNDTYDMSGNTPKSNVMNSIVNDFALNFGKELNKKLDILQEIQKENLRHNSISEQFFVTTLKMLSSIAANSGNRDYSSAIDSMVDSVTKY